MSSPEEFLRDPEGTREELMVATYQALTEYGYAELTVQRISEHFPKSPSLIYHHYDGKDDLLLAFLEFLLERFEETIPSEGDEPARDRLATMLDHALATERSEVRREFDRAMVVLRAQAAHDSRYREQFAKSDRFFRDRLATIIAEGINDGEFADVDPTAIATVLVTTINGAMLQRVTTTEDVGPAVREELRRYVERTLEATQ